MRYFLLFFGLLFITSAQASVVVGATRVIFDGAKNNAEVAVENKDNSSDIVQSWVSVVDATSPAKDAFIITPPLFRLKAGEKGFVRIVRSGKPLAADRESMFWLNVKGIPAMNNMPDTNMVQFAINSKIKLIYRPAELKNSSPEMYAEKLQWQRHGDIISVKNSSPLYMNFSQIAINGKNVSGAWFAAPFATLKIPMEGNLSSTGKKSITWSVINDYGMSGKKYTAVVQ
ncbi:fimbrial assembly chaperone [Klebsiella aerogenes]|uniref:fimbrial assembly chaperone n=1 Tax=Klebsiella aerogenes TaxID=548 RepID=UPI0027771EAD|nr:fimbrial assembly chaperone [Klebsiella aerogenes]HBV9946027.1 fimbrial assembly chaperone [Klebsiella aerogenes]HDS5324222.1 fimbrial assembly chaperone [Klebsiella aerogenes]HED2525263.1 fimbrial assembly chaperone [Klebsiella aerogenes]